MKKRISEYFDSHTGDIIRDIGTLVAIPSVGTDPEEGAPFGRESRRAIQAAYDMAKGYGFDAHIVDDKLCIVEFGSGEPELGILAHLDVVPAGEGWETEPYACVFKDGRLYGRGVSDDKGPAVAALYALKAVKELRLPLKKRVQLILGSDEERGSSDVKWYVKNYPTPPKVFTPDGDFPVINTEKGRIHITFHADVGKMEGVHVVSVHGGTVVNAVPASAEAVVAGITLCEAQKAADVLRGTEAELRCAPAPEGVRVTALGRASHASVCGEGVNAVCALLRYLLALPLSDNGGHRAIRVLYQAIPFGDTCGSALGVRCSDSVSGELTVNLGVFDYSAGGIFGGIDCRVPVSGDGERVFAGVQQALSGALETELADMVRPHNTPETSDFVRGLLRIYTDYTSLPASAESMGGLTYAHEVPGGVCFGCMFPGKEQSMHEANENIELADLLVSGKMFAQAIVEFCG